MNDPMGRRPVAKAGELSAMLERESQTRELMRQVPPAVLGARLKRARQRMGLSIRDLASAAQVSKTSVVRLEAGGTPQVATLLKVCAAIGVHVASLAKPEMGGQGTVAVHRRKDDLWYDLTDFGSGPLKGGGRRLGPAERGRLARVPLSILASRLESGRLLPTVIELYSVSDPRSHAGEEFVYVLSGRARISVGSETFDLEEGESATFWSAEVHTYAPSPGSAKPARVLSVRIDDRPTHD